jgi:SAM-dependent methyltransferase
MTEWYRSFFTGAYQDVQRESWPAATTEQQVAMVEQALALTPGSRILDAPCGTGRLTIPLARRGHLLTGIDFTSAYIEDARRAAAEGGVAVTFLERDMRELEDLSGFDAVINFWGSFGYFDDAGDAAFAAAACRALRVGGRFLVDGHVFETLLPRFQARGWSTHGEIFVLQDRRLDLETSRIESDWTLLAGARIEHKHSSMRLYSARELSALLLGAGFSSVRLLDHSLAPLAIGADRALVVATR